VSIRFLEAEDHHILVAYDSDAAALATYRTAGATDESRHVMLTWSFTE
jgi:hypothetical protein